MADLRREYGIDLLDFWRKRLSFFELCGYLAGLPADCATVRLMQDRPREVEGWSLTNVLLGQLLDTVRGMFAEQAPESVMPKALFEIEQVNELKPMSELSSLFAASPEHFAKQHGS